MQSWFKRRDSTKPERARDSKRREFGLCSPVTWLSQGSYLFPIMLHILLRLRQRKGNPNQIYILSSHDLCLPLYRTCSSKRIRVWNCVIHMGHIVSCEVIYVCKGCKHACVLNICSCNCCLVSDANKHKLHLKAVLTILVLTFASIICCGTYLKTVYGIIYVSRTLVRNCCEYCLI